MALARSFAHKLIALRNQLAPHVTLAWHLSVWGTDEDPTYSKPSLAHMRALGAKSAAFYASLHAHFNLVFNDVTDRDAGFYQQVENNPKTWWGPADFRRHDAYLASFTHRTHTPVVLWQLPLGNTTLNNTWGHYQDNRLQWWLDDPADAHLRATRNAGVVGLLFGGGADGTTTASDRRRLLLPPGPRLRVPSAAARAADRSRRGRVATRPWGTGPGQGAPGPRRSLPAPGAHRPRVDRRGAVAVLAAVVSAL